MDMSKNKEALNVTIDATVLRRMEAWINKQVVKPAKSSTVEAAISAFLDKHDEG